ncbi:monovalent cation/H+ antiporter subunit D family protein [Varunaivibrio sulfuroxidans]|uniref:Multisubunit sodium/proton antiporter MrpD subunit n=1 Tax=Varunaivibrio sulfuroxidans TaxID=1773489 RepID=A0A4R3JDF6_9PROT|nr:monovalent cation/H+ antiporter subunit D family protein [Varunaivibrio sulfuroxidans]TCS64069.1 multisubunit sodium/proton antiporter MrpD subunit [Varunaivibrio sulfuroxidans]WES31480.1 monovalent cation/H+ antiporter subunit D family protein [Varunaivibrio sulfuroxidans]
MIFSPQNLPETLIVLSLIVPLIGALGIVLAGRANPNIREAITLLSATATFAAVAGLYGGVAHGQTPTVVLGEMLPHLNIAFTVEPLGMLFALVASFLWIVTSIYAIGYMRGHHEKHQTRFYFYFAVAIAATLAIAFSGNLLTLFVFYEILTLSTFPLVTHSGTQEAKRAGRVYLGVLMGTSMAFFLFAILWTWNAAGTLDFKLGGILEGHVGQGVASVLLVLFVFGIAKAALMPFHRWLPSAMVAPTPVSALLHAVAVVKAGVFSILKISIYVFGLDFLSRLASNEWLQYLAAATILLASLVAMTKDNLKARLAYSTISQLSYIILGAMLANSLGFIGGAMHIAMHAFAKITLFFCAGAILVRTHKTEVSQMRGIGKTMPLTMLAFLLGSLSIIGLPPMGGLWSKWYLALGALEAHQLVFVVVLMASSLLNIAYLLPIPFHAFFSAPAEDAGPSAHEDAPPTASPFRYEAPVAILIALAITVAGSVALFFYPDPIIDLLKPLVMR